MAAAWTVALLVAAPLAVVGIYCIVPNPEYDCDCAFWILVAVWLLQKLDTKTSAAWGFAAGAFICVPLFFKQNMGLPFLAAVVGAVLLVLAMKWLRRGQAPAAAPAHARCFPFWPARASHSWSAALALHWTAGIGNYLHWTIALCRRAALAGIEPHARRLSRSLALWTLPCVVAALVVLRSGLGKKRWARIAAFALLAAPFLFTLASLLIYDDADSRGDSLLALWPLLLLLAAALAIANLLSLRREPRLRTLLPLILLAAIHGTFMSQQLWGSTYAIWPLLALLVAEMLAFVEGFAARAASRWFAPALAALISVTLLVCGGFYTASEERLSYANLPDGPPAHSAFPQLAGLATPGPYLPEIDELLRYAQANIPFDDGLVLDSRRGAVLLCHRPRGALSGAVLRSDHRPLFAR